MASSIRAVCLLALVLSTVAGCSGGAEQSIVTQFFNASRLRDNTALDNFATVIFDPRSHGTVTAFTVTNVSAEQRKPLPLKALARAQDDVKAEDEAFTRRKDEYQNANLEAIQRVIRAERGEGKVAASDAEVQATWTKFREETAAVSKKMSDARRTLRSETDLVNTSINAGGRTAIDVTKYDGEMVSKEVTIAAPVRLPDGSTVQKTLVVTLQRAILTGDKTVEGRWIVTGFKDAGPSGSTPTS